MKKRVIITLLACAGLNVQMTRTMNTQEPQEQMKEKVRTIVDYVLNLEGLPGEIHKIIEEKIEKNRATVPRRKRRKSITAKEKKRLKENMKKVVKDALTFFADLLKQLDQKIKQQNMQYDRTQHRKNYREKLREKRKSTEEEQERLRKSMQNDLDFAKKQGITF